MTRVTDYEALSSALSKLLFAGGVTNGLPSSDVLRRETEAGTLYWQTLPGCALLLRQREDFQRLSFLATDLTQLLIWQPERRTVLELPWRSRDPALGELGNRLAEQGWQLLLRRIRLSRRGAPPDEAVLGPLSERIPEEANPEAVLDILERCFSPLTGCLPGREELESEEAILLSGGVLHYRRQGNTTELRHLAVLPEHRGRGLARRLIAAYLAREGRLLSRVWTGADNAAALRLYRDYGYTPDGWNSTVLFHP